MTKVCSTCRVEMPVSEFYEDKRYRDGYRGQCRRCIIDRGTEHRRDSPEVRKRLGELQAIRRKADPLRLHKDWQHHLWRAYRLTVEGYAKILEAQGGRCAICQTDDPGGRGRFHVDHDHACCPGKDSCGECVRALLCSRCNPMIAMAQDDPSILVAAAAYLVEYQCEDATSH